MISFYKSEKEDKQVVLLAYTNRLIAIDVSATKITDESNRDPFTSIVVEEKDISNLKIS